MALSDSLAARQQVRVRADLGIPQRAEHHADWAVQMDKAYHKGRHALEAKDAPGILAIVFNRLNVLRNQLVHGGATWGIAVSRDQVCDGAAILGCLLPMFIDLMMDHPDHEWPMPHYPLVD